MFARRSYKDLRNMYLSVNPDCERCGAKAEQVHHIAGRGKGRHCNLKLFMSICRPCHIWIHRNEEQARDEGILLKGMSLDVALTIRRGVRCSRAPTVPENRGEFAIITSRGIFKLPPRCQNESTKRDLEQKGIPVVTWFGGGVPTMAWTGRKLCP